MRPLHLDVPALADAVAHSAHTNDHTLSPRSIRNSLNETNYDMDGNLRQRKSSVASANGHEDANDHTSSPSPSPHASATIEPSTVVHNGARRPSITNPDELRGPQCDAVLAHLTGADLWVHRILATHHKTLETLGVERQAFPNTRLSLKQIETVINPVIALCNMMHPAQFGIHAPTPGIASAMTDMHYWKLWESDTIDVGIFFLPPGGVIPLHNHPGMSVVTRVLYGSAQVTSFDLVPKSELMELPADDVEAGKSDVKWALVSREGDFQAECTMWLDPRRFNLHQIRANDQIGCALLDIMIPPYDNADRDCHHFQILAERSLQQKEKRLVKLLEAVQPDNHNQPGTHRG